jgi:hypothetical protein
MVMREPKTLSADLRTRPEAKPRGNVVTAAQVSAARPLAFACLALAEHGLLLFDDFDEGVVGDGQAIRAPSELLGPLP